MSDDTIFLLTDSGDLQRVPRSPYQNEELLQKLIAEYPELLAGEQINPDDPIQWLLIRREAGVPDGEGLSNRWSVDHLLLDQHGRPTFVEVKRSSDSRIRREVVGQMLDYASNAQVFWPINEIQKLVVEQLGGPEIALQAIQDLLALEPSSEEELREKVEGYWKRVESNLRQGIIRLLFVADELPRELRRVIEFLNQQMTPAEVLGVEIPQYVGGSLRALVPRLVGQTEATRTAKEQSTRSGRRITEEEFLASCSEDVRRFFEDAIHNAIDRKMTIHWSAKACSFRVPRKDGGLCTLLYGYPPGAVGRPTAILEVYTGHLKNEALRLAMRDKFLNIAPLQESGKHTLRLKLDAEGMAVAAQVMNLIWETVAELTGIL